MKYEDALKVLQHPLDITTDRKQNVSVNRRALQIVLREAERIKKAGKSMHIDEKLVWYILDVYTSNPRNDASRSLKHLNECSAASLQQIEIFEETTDQGLVKTHVSAFVQCDHHWTWMFKNTMYGSRKGLSAAADTLIRD